MRRENSFYLFFHFGQEGEEFQYLTLVLQEEVVPACVPSRCYDVAFVEHYLFLLCGRCVLVVEVYHRDEFQFCRILGNDIAEEVVVGCLTYLKIRILIGEAHRHSLAVMLASPSIKMCILQDVVAQAAFIVYEYHVNS